MTLQIVPWGTFLLMAFTLVPNLGLAEGGSAGGGGNTVVCRDDAGLITSAELLDLFEAKNDPSLGLHVVSSSKTAKRQLVDVKRKLSITPNALYDFNLATENISENSSSLKNTRIGIGPTDDYHPRVLPKDSRCKIEPAARYLDGKTLWDNEILGFWKKTNDQTNIAALRAHEPLYWSARANLGVQNSDSVRPVIGMLFSDNVSRDNLVSAINENILERGHKNAFGAFVVRDGNSVQIQFRVGPTETNLSPFPYHFQLFPLFSMDVIGQGSAQLNLADVKSQFPQGGEDLAILRPNRGALSEDQWVFITFVDSSNKEIFYTSVGFDRGEYSQVLKLDIR